MNIEIKKSKNPVNYQDAIKDLEHRLSLVFQNKEKELIWTLEHNEIYTGGTSYAENEILNNSINFVKTNRGGKITYHGPGQLICYFVIDLRNRKKDIRNFVCIIEKTIIQTLEQFNIKSFADRKNIGIWFENKKETQKVAAIGIRVSKWIAYHGFSINIDNDLNKYKNIISCGIRDKGVTNLKSIINQDYNNFEQKIIDNFIVNLKI
ncbi:MAG: octanoyltransferase [Pelagibacteraceae bacterium BACL5 MAG-120705-bin12]|jgi:lipoyl(octanoyl) transferase|nr:MAG: octanoyltransferase [Pelagibacteraceae bacterium BACL5 MAG-120705-bin12]